MRMSRNASILGKLGSTPCAYPVPGLAGLDELCVDVRPGDVYVFAWRSTDATKQLNTRGRDGLPRDMQLV